MKYTISIAIVLFLSIDWDSITRPDIFAAMVVFSIGACLAGVLIIDLIKEKRKRKAKRCGIKPPMHYNCRCVYKPYTKNLFDTGNLKKSCNPNIIIDGINGNITKEVIIGDKNEN